MRTVQILYLLPIFFLVQFQAEGQQTEYFDNVQKEIELAKELYNNGKYIASFREFEIIQQNVDETSELYSEAEYYKSVAALKAGFNSGSKLIKNFVKNYAESPYINSARFNYGDYQFERRQYTPALQTFAKVKHPGLSEDDQIKLHYQMGYSYLMTDNLEKASKEFVEIKDANNLYSKPATYYWAHIMYLQDKYQEALAGFTKLNNDPAYSRVIPLYVSHIYYKQEKYREVVNYTTSIIDEVEKEHKTELSKIVGDSYFHLGEYKNAVPFLETYFDATGLKTREDNYILAYCYYSLADFDKAAPLFENATKGKDEMAQNAYYHLADCYIKLDEKEKAKLAYNAAFEFDFNKKIKEDALFNYAKLTYELSYSPFNETIKAFDKYITLYPNSARNAEAYRILTEVYMVTKNYKDAINSIEKIKVKTPAILAAYQRVTFYRGLELFNNLAYNQAIDFFDTSIESNGHDKIFKARALFWKAEALYRVGDYNNAIASYTQFSSTAGAYSLNEFQDAEYNLAYSYLKLKDYEPAVSHFKKYINEAKNSRTEKIGDALNRVGDYYFLNTNYTAALQNYEQSFSMKVFEPDYALFQIAFCQGLQHNQQEKISNLEKLLADFPESDYQDDALYELGRAYERTGKSFEGTAQYEKLIQNYPQSNYYRKALLQLGLINFNKGDFAKSLTQYKQVAENFAGTPEARAAMSGIKNCYIELNNIEAYFAYAKKLGSGINVTVSEQDSLTFMAAERVYMAGDESATAQLQKYLQNYPNGSFAINANFYLAESLYKAGEYKLANQYYAFVTQHPDNIFTEPALSRASELTFNAENYTGSLELFNRLEKLANSKWNVLKANTGQMRCNLKLERYETAILAAGKIKKSDIANEALIREANYTEGKAYYELNQLGKALPGLKAVSVDTKFEQGAEAKFLIAAIYYQQNKKQEAEDEIMDFVSKNSPYQFWLGNAFLLLTDIYLDKGDGFTAKHTLKSLVENYSNNTDGIKDEALKRLNEIEAKEAQEERNAIDSSFQMEIKQK
ncbi:MAG: tetratricopeptide repeat protein [Draconibacterium sp.]|nr:tetratricopeptide repeat protein [Draconibacterium sp.]